MSDNQPDSGKSSDAGDGTAKADYEVGYKKPPRSTRFRKGRTGNPKGRPKTKDRLGDVVLAALDDPIRVVTESGPKKVPKREVLITSILNEALRGDKKAMRRFIKLAALAGNLKATKPPRGSNVLVVPNLR